MADEKDEPTGGGILDGLDPDAFEEKPDAKATDAKADEKTPQAEGTDAAADAEGGTDEKPPEAASGATDGEEDGDEDAKADDGAAPEGEAKKPAAEARAADAQPASPAPAPDPAADARTARDQRLAVIAGEIEKLEARLGSDDYDHYTDGVALQKLQLEERRLERQATADRIAAAEHRAAEVEAKAAYKDFWQQWAEEHPALGAKRGESVWQEELAKAAADNPDVAHLPEAVRAIARTTFKQRVGTLEGKARADAADKPKPKPTPAPPAANKATATAPGRLVPAGGPGRVAPKAGTPEDVLAATVGGSIRNLLK